MVQDPFETGLRIRKKVLGEAHVEQSMAAVNDFTCDFQDFATTYCWGAGWGREGLPLVTRSLLNIAMLTALGKMHELRLHVGGALRNGASTDDIKEVLMQAAIYCGIPAANDAFRVANEVIEQWEAA